VSIVSSSYGFDLNSLEVLGDLLRQSAYNGEDISCMLPGDIREVLMTSLEFSSQAPTLSEGFAIVAAHWHSAGDFSEASQRRFGQVLSNAVARAQVLGVQHWDDTFNDVVCSKFVRSFTTDNEAPSVGTMHLRRSALRAGFVALRRVGLFKGDPTLDLVLPPRSSLTARAASDDEISLLRMHAVATRASRQPATLALAETSATTSEIPQVRACNLDDPLDPTTVELPGGKGLRKRTARLTPWGAKVLKSTVKSRIDAGVPDDQPLVYFGDKPDEDSPQASVCKALSSIMRRAGLYAEPDLTVRSIGFWAGRQAFEAADTDPVVAAARAMGIKSLDRAASRIDYTWDAR
jgi:integrase/recombinase XerC